MRKKNPYPKIFYFAYGSNINKKQMLYRCNGCKFIYYAVCLNYKFLINKRGVATIIKSKGKKTYGILWLISQKNLKNLDHFEGLKSNRYYRKIIRVKFKEKFINAVTYFSTNNNEGTPKEKYLELILEGINYFKGNITWKNEIKNWKKNY